MAASPMGQLHQVGVDGSPLGDLIQDLGEGCQGLGLDLYLEAVQLVQLDAGRGGGQIFAAIHAVLPMAAKKPPVGGFL